MDLGSFCSLLSEVILVTVLVVAGVAKLISHRSFRRTLELIPWVPQKVLGGLSVIIPVVELLSGLLFLTPWSLGAAWMAAALFVGFSIPVAWAVARGYRVPCACFGALSAAVFDKQTLWRLGFLLVLAIVPIVSGHAVSLSLVPPLTLLKGLVVTIQLWLIYAVGTEVVPQVKKLFG
jgi:hypothetical protein